MGFVSDVVGGVTGSTAADASIDAANIQARSAAEALAATEAATEQGLGFLQPFSQVGQQGLNLSSFLTDPNQQFDFLQNNPLFQMGLDNANNQTNRTAAAGSRLSAGDTLQQLTNNSLLTASPLIQGQKQSIIDLLGIGQQTATAQANTAINQGTNASNLITGRGNALAAGQVGAANAQAAGSQNLLTSGLLAGALF